MPLFILGCYTLKSITKVDNRGQIFFSSSYHLFSELHSILQCDTSSDKKPRRACVTTILNITKVGVDHCGTKINNDSITVYNYWISKNIEHIEASLNSFTYCY